ncbi:YebC/PmpR family DNA-binding transcriptional regulator [Candidatus Marinamargulisbacteria bacterium SCGC AG-343-D04]|nr:YebC/PmpR family DNA-binding transcriptional regulator [Candidatus Marinamargulisbacteria bacterium SCGC AG-343-D04]
MSGHSKWSTIKHKKAKTDAQRGKIFSKISREIIMATKIGGEDTSMNPRLRLALQKAKEANMPNDNIKRAIQKGSGNDEGAQYEELQFEAYAEHGIGLIIDVLTDNKNRTLTNLKVILNKNKASLAEKGAVSYMFNTKGIILFEPTEHDEKIIDLAIENDAEDIEKKEDNSIEIIIPKNNLENLKQIYDALEYAYITASITKIPTNTIKISEKEAESIIKLIEKIEDDEDVQDVYSNFE